MWYALVGIAAFVIGFKVGVWLTNRAVLREVDRLFGKRPANSLESSAASKIQEPLRAAAKGYRWDGD